MLSEISAKNDGAPYRLRSHGTTLRPIVSSAAAAKRFSVGYGGRDTGAGGAATPDAECGEAPKPAAGGDEGGGRRPEAGFRPAAGRPFPQRKEVKPLRSRARGAREAAQEQKRKEASGSGRRTQSHRHTSLRKQPTGRSKVRANMAEEIEETRRTARSRARGMMPPARGSLNLMRRPLDPRGVLLAALSAAVLAVLPALAQEAGLDPATKDRVEKATAMIQLAAAQRKSTFLAYGRPAADRYMALQEFRDKRRRAVLDAAEALLAVRASFPKDQWKALVEQLAAGGPMPLLVERAQKELPTVVPDAARRAPAEKALSDLAGAIKKDEKERESARKKFFSLLEKEKSSGDDFISRLESFGNAEEKLDTAIAEGTGAVQAALTQAEWAELVRRISDPPGR